MELPLSDLSNFRLIGLKLDHKTTNKNFKAAIDCGMLWQKFESEKWLERIPGKLETNIYAIYFDYEGDHTAPFSFFIGCKVAEDEKVPEGMLALQIPSSSYVKYLAKGKMPECIAEAWGEIWKSETNRLYQFDFEIYGRGSWDWNNASVEIYVSSAQTSNNE